MKATVYHSYTFFQKKKGRKNKSVIDLHEFLLVKLQKVINDESQNPKMYIKVTLLMMTSM